MSVTVSSYKNLVGGEWVDSASGETMEVLNPATGEAIAEVPRGTKEDADRAVEAAKKALPEWLETTPGERAELLLKLADLSTSMQRSWPSSSRRTSASRCRPRATRCRS